MPRMSLEITGMSSSAQRSPGRRANRRAASEQSREADHAKAAVIQPSPSTGAEQKGKTSRLDSSAQAPRIALVPFADDPDPLIGPPAERHFELRFPVEQSGQAVRLDVLVHASIDGWCVTALQQRPRR